MVGDGVDDDEALAVADVEVPHGGELLGAGGVQDLEDRGRAVDLNFLAVKVLDGRVVLLHEAPGDELDGEGALAHTARAQHHHFELPHLGLLLKPRLQRTCATPNLGVPTAAEDRLDSTAKMSMQTNRKFAAAKSEKTFFSTLRRGHISRASLLSTRCSRLLLSRVCLSIGLC